MIKNTIDHSPLVSIFMFCKNAQHTINRAIESVLNQTYKNIEFIVQDGASTDNTLDILKSYDQKINLQSMPDSDNNEAFHIALKRCQGEIIGSCLADEELLPHAVEEAVKRFNEYPWVDAFTSDADIINTDYHVIGEYISKDFNLIDYITGAYCPYFVTSFFKRKALVDIGMNSDNWHPRGIEFEIWCRLGSSKNIMYMPGKNARYMMHTNQLSNTYLNVKNHVNARVHVINQMFNKNNIFYEPTSFSVMDALKVNALVRTYAMFAYHLNVHGYDKDAKNLMVEAMAHCKKYFFTVAELNKKQYMEHDFEQLFLHDLSLLLSANFALKTQDIMSSFTDKYRQNQTNSSSFGYDFKKFASLPPIDPYLYHSTALIFVKLGLINQAMILWKSVEILDNITIGSMAVQAALKHPGLNSQAHFSIQKKWVNKYLPNIEFKKMAYSPKNKIRIAYLGYNWHADYMQYQCANFVKFHNKKKFEAICYSGYKTPDYVGSVFDVVKEVGSLNDRELSHQLISDGIDVAVEINGFSQGHRYVALGYRSAPVQISYINHNGTSCVPNVDYVLADDIAAPNDIDNYYSEKIYRLPGCFTCFSYDTQELPDINTLPFEKNKYITFGCFGGGYKFNHTLLMQWVMLLNALPNSILYLRNLELSTQKNQHYFTKQFTDMGINKERLRIEPGTNREGIIKSYNDVDISLDTWPYCGGNTLAESLWMGVPAVSYRGSTFSAAYGASILAGSGLKNYIANSMEEYVSKLVDLANDIDRLIYLRKNLRQMVVDYGFGDAKKFALKIENAYCKMLDDV